MIALAAAAEGGYEAPGVADFWQPLIGDGAFAITRPIFVFGISAILLCIVLVRATRNLSVVPGKGQALLEASYSLVRNSIGRDIIGAKDFIKFIPLLFSLFTVILVNNLFGIIPVVQYPTMSRIGFPIALALVVYVVYHFLGARKHGVGGWIKRISIPPDVPGFVLPLLILLELNTYFIVRPVTLALRLFGNMFAGHILLLLFILGGEYLVFESGSIGLAGAGLVTWLMAFVMTCFELLVQFLQAYIFTLLAALYIADALADEH
ncbi:F0F1 ATP synthase subunit A [Spongisporangium articulatum]|uniref:ATP synthase subunit a n=1 Tax=Spongisporangium articulatum TaxID=3362603 RepID=A0ABW8AUB6_9ACTN